MNQALLTITGGPAYPVHFSLVEYIERIIHRYPSNAAAFDEDQRLTYSELRIELLTLHARLHELGVRSGDVVAVNATVQLRYPVVVLGLLLAGLVYLPIAAALPPERKRAICEQARPALMITDEQSLMTQYQPVRSRLCFRASPSVLPSTCSRSLHPKRLPT